MVLAYSLFVLFCALWSSYFLRQVGGGPLGVWLAKYNVSSLLNFVVVIPIAIAVWMNFNSFWEGLNLFNYIPASKYLIAQIVTTLLSLVWSGIWLNTGHGTAFKMGREPETAQSGRKQDLSIVVDPICKLFGWTLGESKYCWLFMGLKGLLIGLPTLMFAPLFIVLYPLAYELGYRFPLSKWFQKNVIKEPGTFTSEWYAGLVIGLLGGLATVIQLALHLV